MKTAAALALALVAPQALAQNPADQVRRHTVQRHTHCAPAAGHPPLCTRAHRRVLSALLSCPRRLQSLYTSFPNLVDIDGMPASLARFKGNVLLVINVATY